MPLSDKRVETGYCDNCARISFIGRLRSTRTASPYDRHRFVTRGTLGWIETGDFDKVPPDLRFFAGGDRSIRGYKYKSIAPKYANGAG